MQAMPPATPRSGEEADDGAKPPARRPAGTTVAGAVDASRADVDAGRAVEAIGQTMGRMRLMMGRRIIGRLAMREVAPTLELSHLDVIEAVRRAAGQGEPTVGSVAEALRIDHSRGSRLVAELIQRGLLRRAVSQADARRTVVELTDEGWALVEKTREIKHALIAGIVASWSPDDVERFADLFTRFVDGFHAAARARDAP